MGIIRRATPDIRKLSLSAKFPVQECPRVHSDICEAASHQNQRAEGETVQRSDGRHGENDLFRWADADGEPVRPPLS